MEVSSSCLSLNSDVEVVTLGNKEYISSVTTDSGDYQSADYQNRGIGSELEQLIEAFKFCDTVEIFASVIEDKPSEIVEDAIALAPTQPRRLQLQQWYESVKQVSERPTLASYTPGDEVWGYFPQSESKWLKGSVEWVRGNTVRVISGIFGIYIERKDAIAPGDWVLSG
jgi:hypothetical protein